MVIEMKYDVSVIIPFYNNELYLDECILSVLNQKYDTNKIEIVLINDCSIDNSLKIAQKYENLSNVVLINKTKNEGVSSARNDGIKNAHGKYIMLLDGDDYISEDSISLLVDFFDKHYDEVDMVTYPIYLKIKDGRPHIQKKYEYYDKGSSIYSFDEYPYVNQTTINVIVKNDKSVFFDEKLKVAEDKKFNTTILMKKQKIGYCDKAQYIYRRYGGGVSQVYNNMFYCFENIVGFNEWLIKEYQKNGVIPKYIQGMILNTLSWRFRDDMLFPYYLEGKEYDDAVERIFSLIKYVDDDMIYNYKNMSLNHKLYFIKKKNSDVKISLENNCISLFVNDVKIDSFDSAMARVKRNQIHGNNLYFMGIFSEDFYDINNAKLYLNIKKKDDSVEKREISLFESKSSYNKSRVKLFNIMGFEFDLDLSDVKSFKLVLKYFDSYIDVDCVHDVFASSKKYSKKYIINYIKLKRRYAVKKNNFISRVRYCVVPILKFKISFLTQMLKTIGVFIPSKDVWLYCDNGNLDNAYFQFCHDIEQKDNIKKYYVCSPKSAKLVDKKYQKNIIIAKSLKNKIAFLKSKKIFTSNSSLISYCPFRSYSKVKDVIQYELIYLQHGVLHANLSFLYNKENTEISKIIISTEFEKENLMKNYGYRSSDLLKFGMPRYDMISKKTSKIKNRILFAPSWRYYLSIEGVKGEDIFKKSNYYKNINSLINDPKFISFLEKNKIYFDIKLHPIFMKYSDFFEYKSKYINICNTDVNLKEYKVLITDFSSFQFDFIDNNRPIIYYIPDKSEYSAGLHTYRNLDLPYEKAFGNLYYDYNDLVEELIKLGKNKFKVDAKISKRMKSFLDFGKIGTSRERIYNAAINDE